MKKSDCFCSIEKLHKSKKSWIFTRIWLSFLTKCLPSNQIAHYPRAKNGHDIMTSRYYWTIFDSTGHCAVLWYELSVKAALSSPPFMTEVIFQLNFCTKNWSFVLWARNASFKCDHDPFFSHKVLLALLANEVLAHTGFQVQRKVWLFC